MDAPSGDPSAPSELYSVRIGPQPCRHGALCSAVALSLSEVVVQFAHLYGATQLTTRQATPPLHFTWVLHWP